MLDEPWHNSVPAFMIGNCFLCLGCYQLTFFLYTTYDSLGGHLEIDYWDEFFVVSSSYDGSFIANIFYICSAESWCQCSQSLSILFEICTSLHGKWFEMNLKDFSSSLEIWQIYLYKSIESARSGQSWI